jgi:hypothetical protein
VYGRPRAIRTMAFISNVLDQQERMTSCMIHAIQDTAIQGRPA